LFYLVVKGENLILPMITGYYHGKTEGPSSFYKVWRALLIAVLAAAVVYGLVY
jgi:VIT1/CCC1 family predicted Fe2+/Mn2+ transporter